MSPVLGCVLAFLAAALLLYAVLAGADFGAGIWELFGTKAQRQAQRPIIAHAMAPVWEANHVWLILAVVIVFVAFPSIYSTVTTYLHLPILALLMGIVARGCAFTFRHYDTFDANLHAAYSRIFAFSSLWTSFFVGVVAAACSLGRIDPHGLSYASLYIAPWLNTYCAMVGVFTCCLFAFVAAVFLVGETQDVELQVLFRRRATASAGATLACGAAVFGVAQYQGLRLAQLFFSNTVSCVAFVAAQLLWAPLFWALRCPRRVMAGRLLGATALGLILLGWFALRYPVALALAGGDGIMFATAAAPRATLEALLGALVTGSLVIFPGLAYLFTLFKWPSPGHGA